MKILKEIIRNHLKKNHKVLINNKERVLNNKAIDLNHNKFILLN